MPSLLTTVALIISTYNWPEALELAFLSIIADDSSNAETDKTAVVFDVAPSALFHYGNAVHLRKFEGIHQKVGQEIIILASTKTTI